MHVARDRISRLGQLQQYIIIMRDDELTQTEKPVDVATARKSSGRCFGFPSCCLIFRRWCVNDRLSHISFLRYLFSFTSKQVSIFGVKLLIIAINLLVFHYFGNKLIIRLANKFVRRFLRRLSSCSLDSN